MMGLEVGWDGEDEDISQITVICGAVVELILPTVYEAVRYISARGC